MNFENFNIFVSSHLNKSFFNDLVENEAFHINESGLLKQIKLLGKNNGKKFFVLGLLNGKVITSCIVDRHYNNNSYYLISYFETNKNYKNFGYGTKLIEYTIMYLKELCATKVCMFCASKESMHIAIKLGFIKNESVNSFGCITPCKLFDDFEPVYYEYNISSNFYLSNILEDDAEVIASFMYDHYKDYSKSLVIPNFLNPNESYYKNEILKMNERKTIHEYALKCGMVTCGYMNCYYDMNYLPEIGFELFFHKDYLFNDAIELFINKLLMLYNEIKKTSEVKELFILKKSIISSQEQFISNALLKHGFVLNDNKYSIFNE